MSDQNKCRQTSELLPLYYSSGLKQEEAETVRSHLQGCETCRVDYAREQAMFAVAGSNAAADLASHPDTDVLDEFARAPESISAGQRDELDAHLAGCMICREATAKLRTLPDKLDDLAPTEYLPLIAELDETACMSSDSSTITDLTRRIWKPLTAIAAAAVVVLVGVTIMTFIQPGSVARVEGTFPSPTRTASAPTVFEAEHESFTFAGRLYVDPEMDHDYSIQVRDIALDSIIFQVTPLVTFDRLGFATVELTMSPGKYELVLWDVVDTDSLKTTQLFDIRMKH